MLRSVWIAVFAATVSATLVGLSPVPVSSTVGQNQVTVGDDGTALSPPFRGVLWLDPTVVTPQTSTDYVAARYRTVEDRYVFDRRSGEWAVQEMHVVDVFFDCALPVVEFLVNGEFSKRAAVRAARKYGQIVGQLPAGLREKVKEVWIHRGWQPAGGGYNSILIHTDQVESVWHWVEEVLLHEAAHTSLDYVGGGAVREDEWLEAARLDGAFISDYAAQFPVREDIAESYGAFLLWERTTITGVDPVQVTSTIGNTIPSRLRVFQSLGAEYSLHADVCPRYGEPVPPTSVRDTRVREGKSGVSVVSWKPPVFWGAGQVQGYEYRLGTGRWKGTLSTSVTVSRKLGSKVHVQVRAVNEAGHGPAITVT